MLGRSQTKAFSNLERSFAMARDGGFARDEGIIAELLARRLLEAGLKQAANSYYLVARDAFERCGYLAKVRDIDQILGSQPSQALESLSTQPSPGQRPGTWPATESSKLDTPTLTRAAYALSREIHLDGLKKTLLQLLVENAGARHAVLLWRAKTSDTERSASEIVAYRSSDGQCFVDPIPPADAIVSLRVLSYLDHNPSVLIISQLDLDPIWKSDDSLRERQVKSLLCVPIMVGGEPNGFIYLENNLLENAFTIDRVEILRVLAGQIAISLDNATLYGQLKLALLAEQSARHEEMSAHKAYLKAEQARLHLQAGIEAAEAVQKSLINVRKFSPQYEIAHIYDPSENAGGDWLSTFYDSHHDWLVICLGDVTGHGISSALLAAAAAGAAASSIAGIHTDESNLGVVLNRLMNAMHAAVSATRGASEQLMTMVTVGINLKSGEGYYLNAGHNPVLWMGDKLHSLLIGGNPLGLSVKSFGQKNFQLIPGDLLLLYSDGLLENPDKEGSKLKFKELRNLIELHRTPESLIDHIRQKVALFAHNTHRDDTSCLAISWKGPTLR
jgi:serine phosphatase RsbU (regulator of sigma subunit)